MRVILLSVLVAATTAACTWVPIEQSGKGVQVLPAGLCQLAVSSRAKWW